VETLAPWMVLRAKRTIIKGTTSTWEHGPAPRTEVAIGDPHRKHPKLLELVAKLPTHFPLVEVEPNSNVGQLLSLHPP